MWKEVKDRELGRIRPALLANRVQSRRICSLELANQKEIISAHKGAVNSLQIDLTESRYLLSGASDGSAAVYDIQQATDNDGGGLVAKHKSLFVVDKQLEYGHQYAVSSVSWYPVDTGLFVTGSFDHHIKVWDTNTTQVEMQFKLPGKVYGVAMSSVSTTHMLIAAGTEDVQVRLCDMASGAFTHTLSGHRDGVWAVQWSASNEWMVITGGCDGSIRFWDIRRAGCFRVLDQLQSQTGRRPSIPKSPASKAKKSSMAFGKGLSKGSLSQRQHPGMLSSQNRATAHYGAVTGLEMTNDGLHLFSAGMDSRLRLWDVESGCNTLVNYETTRLRTSKAIQLAVTPNSSLVFVPCLTSIKAYDVWSGSLCSTFHGHYDFVNCCSFNSQDQELYSGSNDRQILIWSPPAVLCLEEDETPSRGPVSFVDEDNWSD
ncbi:hypothetical protein KI387_040448 [Taxus chinensis]|uniref:DNA excision repair protein ERCC-8 n=2 Tax=Taxus chinensis TaxID=29808 RepID=A0AA38C8E3_TAXCH|nr:hypothetical protein KI387_040448 [Taxus chinensis]